MDSYTQVFKHIYKFSFICTSAWHSCVIYDKLYHLSKYLDFLPSRKTDFSPNRKMLVLPSVFVMKVNSLVPYFDTLVTTGTKASGCVPCKACYSQYAWAWDILWRFSYMIMPSDRECALSKPKHSWIVHILGYLISEHITNLKWSACWQLCIDIN